MKYNLDGLDDIVLLDCDGILLDLLPTWIQLYNTEFNQNLDWRTIDDWDTRKFVITSARERLFEYVEHADMFYGSEAVDGALDGVNYLRSIGKSIYVVTVNNPENAKLTWLKEKHFIKDDSEFILCKNKSMVFGGILFDDNFDNCNGFRGTGILMNKPYNLKFDYPHRVNNWEEFLRKII
jgi:5'(3')-deoxyribonucleotidase